MLQIKSLKDTAIEDIAATFNLAFSDYIIPLQLTPEQLRTRIEYENATLDDSVGAFEDGRLVGVMLHYVNTAYGDKNYLYNGGTGVIPQARGQHLTEKMYQHILSQDHVKKQYEGLVLEVLENNIPAIKSYEKVGFCKDRVLKCYSGEVKSKLNTNYDIHIRHIKKYNEKDFVSWSDYLSTWQCAYPVVKKSWDRIYHLGAYIDNICVGMIIVNPDTRRIIQLAIDPDRRRQGIASTLVNEIVKLFGRKLRVINVDESATVCHDFYTHIGLQNNINQYEMKLKF